MKVAIIGAGLAGLSTAWNLLHLSQASISLDIYDPQAIGEGTSGIASGLLHPYTGSRAKLHWEGKKMMTEAHALLTASSAYTESSSVISKGLLRPALTLQEMKDFQLTAENHSDCEWWDRKKLQEYLPQVVLTEECGGGLFLPQGLTIDVKKYLKGLLQAILRLGGRLHPVALTDPSILGQYNRIIFAMGSNITLLDFFKNLPLTMIKGQVLEVAWPEGLSPLPTNILSSTHIIMRPDNKSCLIGATFERNYSDPNPDPPFAKQELLTKAGALLPPLRHAQVLSCKSGIRVCSHSHLPMIGNVTDIPEIWFITGLCGKGLLCHGLLGSELALAVLANDPALISPEIYHGITALSP